MELFQIATKSKFRFQTTKGNITTEDLWDLNLEALDKIAIALNREVKDSTEESFVKEKTSTNKALALRLEVVKFVIDSKLQEKEDAKVKAEKANKKALLQDLILEKKMEATKSKSIEELEAELKAL